MLRLCCPGAASATFLLPLKCSVQDSSARGLASRPDAAFVHELQKRVSAAAVGHFVTSQWLLKPASSLKAAKCMCAQQAAQQHVQPRPLAISLFRSGLTKTARAQSRRLHLFKLATAAVAGIVTLQALRGHQNDPETSCVQQSSEAYLMADLQRNLDNPAVRPGYPLVCSEWLQQRQTLLQAERSAWQILPSTVGQISRLEEIESELQATAVMMNAVLSTMQSDNLQLYERLHTV